MSAVSLLIYGLVITAISVFVSVVISSVIILKTSEIAVWQMEQILKQVYLASGRVSDDDGAD